MLCEEVFNTLSEREKIVLIMRFREEKTFKEIGKVLNVSTSRAMQICNLMLRRIRKKVIFLYYTKEITIKTPIDNCLSLQESQKSL